MEITGFSHEVSAMEKNRARGCSQKGPLSSKTCREGGVKLFGVRLTDSMIRKSVSMSNLACYNVVQTVRSSTPDHSESGDGLVGSADPQGYVSDGLVQNSGTLREKKKGVPWTEEEHRMFLIGLQKLGKGDWRGIARNFVPSRTSTQVASHAQKYFLRQSNLNKRKRRTSLFDIISSDTVPMSPLLDQSPNHTTELSLATNSEPRLSLVPMIHTEESNALFTLRSINAHASDNSTGISAELCSRRPHEKQPHGTFDYKFSLHQQLSVAETQAAGRISDPKQMPVPSTLELNPSTSSTTPALCRSDEVAESLRLSIGPPLSLEPLELSLKLEQPASRHSAFHSSSGSMLNMVVRNRGSTHASIIRVV